MLSPADIESLLHDLCVEHGFCLPADARAKLREHPPSGVTAFVDAVYREEGLDPATADRRAYRLVHAAVAQAFRRSGLQLDDA